MLLLLTKLYLAGVAVMYAGLAAWCGLRPEETSEKVGFALRGGTGQSEFFTIYGGLELGMAVVFAVSLCKHETLRWGLLTAVILHGGLVLFRTIAFFKYKDFDQLTYKLAIGEWAILVVGIALLVLSKRS